MGEDEWRILSKNLPPVPRAHLLLKKKYPKIQIAHRQL
jgi:hypothetical protein